MRTKYDNFEFKNIYVGDIEVYNDYFLIVLADVNKNLEFNSDCEDNFKCIWIDSRMQDWECKLRALLEDNLFIGFNNSSYDNKIIRFIAGTNARYPNVKKCDLSKLKKYSDSIIENKELPNYNKTFFYSLDIRNECNLNNNLSLKDIEYHLNLDVITEDESFNIDVSNNNQKLEDIIKYCKHDVFTTYLLIKHSLNNEKGLGNFENKLMSADLTISTMKSKNDYVDFDVIRRIISGKPATIAAKMFEIKTDGKYEMWYNINERPIIIKPRTPLAFDIYKKRTQDIFSKICDFKLGDVTVNFGTGGLHTINSADTQLEIHKNVYNFDVASFYPSFIEKYSKIANFNLDLYRNLKAERLKLKKKKDDINAVALQLAYKLMINATSGKYNEEYRNNQIENNPLYNPHVYYSMTTSCQLMLLDLAESLINIVNIVQLNTDGIAFTLKDTKDLDNARAICKEWELYYGYELEESFFDSFIQLSVNDYIAVYYKEDDVKCKSKGASFGDLRGLSASADFISNILNLVFQQYDKDSLDFERISYFIDKTVDNLIESNNFKALQVNLKAVSTVKDKYIYNCNGLPIGERTKGSRGFIVKKSADTVKVKSNQLKIEQTFINIAKSSGRKSVRRVKVENELDNYLDIQIHNEKVLQSEYINYNADGYKLLCKRAILDMMKHKYVIDKNGDSYSINVI